MKSISGCFSLAVLRSGCSSSTRLPGKSSREPHVAHDPLFRNSVRGFQFFYGKHILQNYLCCIA